ncbi:resolvase domain [Clostridium sp. CAG:451]|jgi:site-specific DNA recombinase|nr:resolvase domain [Clostridium sp. CAG:451]
MNNNTSNYLVYAIYSRKSKFTGKGESIENQIELCKNQLINKYNIKEENIKIYQDEGFTGYNTNRPQFQEMIKDIRNKKIKCVIVYRLDRISRNVTDFCNLKNEFIKYNTDFISVTENFDTSTPMGRAMLMISSVFAQLERDTIAERIRDNMYELAKTGRWLGGNTPLGYKSEKVETLSVDGKRKNLYKLDIVFEEAEIIKLIWNKMCELKSLSKLEVYLLQKGIKTRNGNNFTRFSLITILKNPVYVVADNKIKDFFEKMNVTIYETDIEKCNGINGLLAYNKREELMGKTKSYKDITEWIIAVGKHQGIIPSQQFIKVWNLIVNNKDKRCRVPRQNTSILSGIIRCKHCGNYMRPRLRNTVTIDNKRNFSYLCVLKEKSRKRLCKCKNINGIETDMIVIEKISELKLPTNMLINKIKLLINNKEKESDKRINELQTLNTILSRNKRKVEALIDKMAIIDGELIADITAQIKSIKSKNLEIEKRIIELSKEMEKEIDKDEVTVLALNIINKYMSSFDSLNIVDKRLMIKSLVNTIESDGENIYINYMGCP